MASTSRVSRIKGAMCVLVKECILRITKAGDVVVLIEHVEQSGNVQEALTLLVYEHEAYVADAKRVMPHRLELRRIKKNAGRSPPVTTHVPRPWRPSGCSLLVTL
jgi:hypothetical protein